MTATYEKGVIPSVEINEEFEQKIKNLFDETKSKVLDSF